MIFLILYLFALLVLFVVIRVLYIKNVVSNRRTKRFHPARTLIVLGSGSHTAEMLAILRQMNKTNYSPRFYVLSETDSSSQSKIVELEEPNTSKNDYQVFRIKPSRHVGQSYITAVFTTLLSILQSIPLVYRLRPDLILTNGPGTCVPICIIAFVLKVVGALDLRSKIVFVESFCRVDTVSLSGKMLIWFADCFVVQWPQLTAFSKEVQYFGRLM